MAEQHGRVFIEVCNSDALSCRKPLFTTSSLGEARRTRTVFEPAWQNPLVELKILSLADCVKSGKPTQTYERMILEHFLMHPPNETTIRSALYRKKLRRLQAMPDTLVIYELGLAHAKSRIDVAVINGCVHGYEIKSGQDTLNRLPSQIKTYQDTVEKLTIVCASKHVDGVTKLAPTWCGILEARQGPRGAVHFHTVRRGRRNPKVNPVMLAHLLWRPEVITLLSLCGLPAKNLRKPRKQLYELLAERLTLKEITASIQEFMQTRQAWRDRPAHA